MQQKPISARTPFYEKKRTELHKQKSAEILWRNCRMFNENKSSEDLYESLTKAFQSSIRVIKYVVYPATGVLVLIIAFGIWWGLDIKKSRSEISSTKLEVENIHKSLSLKSREIEISAKEIESNTKKRFEGLTAQFSRFESGFNKMNSDFLSLKSRYEEALNENDELFTELKADNQSLSEFSDAIKKTITEYTDEIAYARKGVEQRKKDIESILKKRNEQLEAIQKSTVLLLEYLVLMQSKSNVMPNPNIQKGINILNKILVILVPDEKERAAIVTRINESIKDE